MENKPTQRPEHSDSWDRAKYMFRRHSRQLTGLLLVCIVAGIIFYVAVINPKKPTTGSSWSASRDKAASGDSSYGAADTLLTDITRAGDSDDADSSDSLSSTANTKPNNVPTSGSNLEEFLAEASNSQLVKELLRLRDLRSTSLPHTFVIMQRRTKIGKRLMDLDEATADEKLFAINDYIETIIQLDAINQLAGLDADHVRPEFISVRDKFSNHADDAVGSKASLAYVLIPIHDFSRTKDPAELKKTADLFDTHADKITRHFNTTDRFALLIIDLYRNSEYSEGTKELAVRVMQRLEKQGGEKNVAIAEVIRERILFSECELDTLVDRIEGGNEVARSNVQALFEGLDAHPSSRVEIYKTATNVIFEYWRLGHDEDAKALTKWITEINEKNTSEDKEEISEAIAAFDKRVEEEKSYSPLPPSPPGTATE